MNARRFTTESPRPPAAAASAGSSARVPYTPPDILLTRGQKRGGRRGEEAAAHGGQGLADQRTAECGALGGSRQECPGWQEDGPGGSRESRPSEGRYKGEPAGRAPRSRVHEADERRTSALLPRGRL